ncbi:hypothetical protein B0H12DRAFT_1240014 [Mycena haematopus]|nr:hypothetical protein B0H12DRAFT_1244308 [Mycena haematopus]KAJ7231297.1 hypothetical protein B0H12DRAFT_1240014 [Mycena haematopus]
MDYADTESILNLVLFEPRPSVPRPCECAAPSAYEDPPSYASVVGHHVGMTVGIANPIGPAQVAIAPIQVVQQVDAGAFGRIRQERTRERKRGSPTDSAARKQIPSPFYFTISPYYAVSRDIAWHGIDGLQFMAARFLLLPSLRCPRPLFFEDEPPRLRRPGGRGFRAGGGDFEEGEDEEDRVIALEMALVDWAARVLEGSWLARVDDRLTTLRSGQTIPWPSVAAPQTHPGAALHRPSTYAIAEAVHNANAHMRHVHTVLLPASQNVVRCEVADAALDVADGGSDTPRIYCSHPLPS